MMDTKQEPVADLVERLRKLAAHKPFVNRNDDEFINQIAKTFHDNDSDDYTKAWSAQKSNYRGSVRKATRQFINALLSCGLFPVEQSDLSEAATTLTSKDAEIAALQKQLGECTGALETGDKAITENASLREQVKGLREALERIAIGAPEHDPVLTADDSAGNDEGWTRLKHELPGSADNYREEADVVIRAYLTALRPASDEAVEAMHKARAALAAMSNERNFYTAKPAIDALDAALAHTGKPTVKALEWEYLDDSNAWAHTPFLVYVASSDGTWLFRNGIPTKAGDDLEAAQAACQADYEARVRSALQTGGET